VQQVRGDRKGSYRFSVGGTSRNRQLGRPKRRREVIKWILKKWFGKAWAVLTWPRTGMDWCGSRQGEVASSSGRDKEHSGSIVVTGIYWLPKRLQFARTLLHGVGFFLLFPIPGAVESSASHWDEERNTIVRNTQLSCCTRHSQRLIHVWCHINQSASIKSVL